LSLYESPDTQIGVGRLVHPFGFWRKWVAQASRAAQSHSDGLCLLQGSLPRLKSLRRVCEPPTAPANKGLAYIQNGYSPATALARTKKPWPRSTIVAWRPGKQYRAFGVLPFSATGTVLVAQYDPVVGNYDSDASDESIIPTPFPIVGLSRHEQSVSP
jgi:hypothetical protein